MWIRNRNAETEQQQMTKKILKIGAGSLLFLWFCGMFTGGAPSPPTSTQKGEDTSVSSSSTATAPAPALSETPPPVDPVPVQTAAPPIADNSQWQEQPVYTAPQRPGAIYDDRPKNVFVNGYYRRNGHGGSTYVHSYLRRSRR